MMNECDWCYGDHQLKDCESYEKAILVLSIGLIGMNDPYDGSAISHTLFYDASTVDIQYQGHTGAEIFTCCNALRSAINARFDIVRLRKAAKIQSGFTENSIGLVDLMRNYGDPLFYLVGSTLKQYRLDTMYKNPMLQ